MLFRSQEGGGGNNKRGYSCGFFGWQYCESCDGGVGEEVIVEDLEVMEDKEEDILGMEQIWY